MNLHVLENYESISAKAAGMIADVLKQKPAATICLASGHTPAATFGHLVRLAKDGKADFSQCHFIGLDEWVGIPPPAEGSCRYFLDEFFFKYLNIPASRIHFFDGMAPDLSGECRKMDETIARLGGMDVMLLGIGMNGHIALNEPGTPWNLRSHVVELDQTTVQVGQKYFREKTHLASGITLGLQYVKEAELALLMASGKEKAAIVRKALEGEITEQLPASIFQTLPDAVILLDEAAATELNRR